MPDVKPARRRSVSTDASAPGVSTDADQLDLGYKQDQRPEHHGDVMRRPRIVPMTAPISAAAA